ncbi:MAG: hypothetical protein A2X36_10080 [Elusimicrobia bacterium GWA2_69_24]|nr:MAG: hypothetical protein A2X36_10080 [Elusimicrobia bacterium GWA2_69_24]HBL17550.1 aquaporin [Elusimicrobiota bacterium]
MAGNLRGLIAEFLGTFAWVLFVAGALCSRSLEPAMPRGSLPLALTQGLAVTAVFGLLGRYSFGYFNPALTLALALWRRIDWVRASLSIFFQLLGSALAALLLLHAYPDAAGEPLHLGAPSLGAIGFRTATLVECVLSFFFALAVTRSTVEQGHPSFRTRAVFIGAVAAAAALCAGPLTGAVINPARAFGPALASGFWTHQYVFWIGSLAGSLAGVSLTQTLYKSHQEKT